MSAEALSALATILTLVTAAAGAIAAAYRFFDRRDRIAAVRLAFSEALDALNAEEEIRRHAGAILLRRFFDTQQEFGVKAEQTQYADAALSVIAATLRGIETGNFQKLLADGLRFAPSLDGADLQKTNLQGAYLGVKGDRRVSLKKADFYRADLTQASLRGVDASGADFYQARLIGTVLKDANLAEANFYDSDLMGAQLAGATLDGASFGHARNIPEAVVRMIDKSGTYVGKPTSGAAPSVSPVVFVSRPGAANIDTRQYIRALVHRISEEDIDVFELERNEYPESGAVAEVRRLMSGCSGAVAIAAPDLEIRKAEWRSATPDAREISDVAWASPWTVLELGVATGLGLPLLLVVADGVSFDVFDFAANEPAMYTVALTDDHMSRTFRVAFDDWIGAVRERSHR